MQSTMTYIQALITYLYIDSIIVEIIHLIIRVIKYMSPNRGTGDMAVNKNQTPILGFFFNCVEKRSLEFNK